MQLLSLNKIGGKMSKSGKKQTLLIVKSVEFGVYLAEDMRTQIQSISTFAGKTGSGRDKSRR